MTKSPLSYYYLCFRDDPMGLQKNENPIQRWHIDRQTMWYILSNVCVDVMVGDHQQEQEHSQDVWENCQLHVCNHSGKWICQLIKWSRLFQCKANDSKLWNCLSDLQLSHCLIQMEKNKIEIWAKFVENIENNNKIYKKNVFRTNEAGHLLLCFVYRFPNRQDSVILQFIEYSIETIFQKTYLFAIWWLYFKRLAQNSKKTIGFFRWNTRNWYCVDSQSNDSSRIKAKAKRNNNDSR